MRALIHAGIAVVGVTTVLALPIVATTSSASSPTSIAALPGAPDVGAVLDKKFGTPPMNSSGLTDLAELRGRPLLIDFWGVR